MRVMSDHIRTISFAIADGQLPSNVKAGYVIRRILRRAVRYYYSFLNVREPLLNKMVAVLSNQMKDVFPELVAQQELIVNVIKEEETAFLRTLGNGIIRFTDYLNANQQEQVIKGDFAFELYDTYGFPLDLTQLLAREKGLTVDVEGFNKGMQEQKNRSRAAATVDTADWVVITEQTESVFVGYDLLETESEVIRYRKVKQKNKELYQLVLNVTPFYAESGGQVGDSGVLVFGEEIIAVFDTRKENGVWMHFTDKLPSDIHQSCIARVHANRRKFITSNHSATHLMHAALRKVLGTHVEQKGSLVNEKYLRFDFSHFAKMSDEQMAEIEQLVNEKIRENIQLQVENMKIEEALATGAMALFGEKYGEEVRVVSFDKNYSVELCGGTHVQATGEIGVFKFLSESAVAAGIRRVEAVTNQEAMTYFNNQLKALNDVRQLLKNPKDLNKSIEELLQQQSRLNKKLEEYQRQKAKEIKKQIISEFKKKDDYQYAVVSVSFDNIEMIRELCMQLVKEQDNSIIIVGNIAEDKPSLYVSASSSIVENKKFNASEVVKKLAAEIRGGGGGQAFYANAGGTFAEGLPTALNKALELLP
jgi:alanyl-tRNA synthetase